MFILSQNGELLADTTGSTLVIEEKNNFYDIVIYGNNTEHAFGLLGRYYSKEKAKKILFDISTIIDMNVNYAMPGNISDDDD